ncbi:MAG: SOS response-associated peptidase family protein [Ignavibacteria bacterium]|nr:SOS response-associated peptidase family protein [Ignavibacteria bacterium]
MCTNYDRYITDKEIKKKMKSLKYPLKNDDEFTDEDYKNLKEGDLRLTSPIMSIKLNGIAPVISIMKWSINWNPKMPIYNSRIETIREQSRWKTIFSKSRCLIPATSFYEYRPFENDPPDVVKIKKEKKIKRKTKFRISVKGEKFFFIGGIFVWNKDFNYCSMITTPPHKDLKKIPHHRCPLIILSEDAKEYLEGDAGYLIDSIKSFTNSRELDISQSSDY